MARTGISIRVSNTTLGGVPQVNSNSMLVVMGATATTGGIMPFALETSYMLQSPDDLETLGIDETNNYDVFHQVNDYYAPKGGVSNSGNVLWLVGVTTGGSATAKLAEWLRATVVQGFQYRPRQIMIYTRGVLGTVDASDVQSVIDNMYTEGFSTVAIVGATLEGGSIETTYQTLADMSLKSSPMVGMAIVTNRQGDGACVGAIGGFLASLSVGTSIGDASLSQFSGSMYFTDATVVAGSPPTITYVNTPCAKVALGVVNVLGDKQFLFTRTRPPKNGLWFNDGATCEDAATALSTLEAGRVIASMVDDLRAYFTPYINQKVPVSSNGDIRGDYKQVVLNGAQSEVVEPYRESGDISDAVIDLKAKNNDMIGTRTWEVTLKILPAPTLRWIDGYVFYVSSLT